MCLGMCRPCPCAGAHRDRKLEFHVVVNHLTWVLGNRPESYARVARAFSPSTWLSVSLMNHIILHSGERRGDTEVQMQSEAPQCTHSRNSFLIMFLSSSCSPCLSVPIPVFLFLFLSDCLSLPSLIFPYLSSPLLPVFSPLPSFPPSSLSGFFLSLIFCQLLSSPPSLFPYLPL